MPDRPNDPDHLTPPQLVELRRSLHQGAGTGVSAAPADDSQLVTDALLKLGEYVDAVLAATKDDRPDRIQDLLHDGAMIHALARAGQRRNEVEAALVPLEGFRGGVKLGETVRKLVRQERRDSSGLRLAGEGEGASLEHVLSDVLGDHEIPLLTEPEGWVVTTSGVLKRNNSEDNPVTRLNFAPLLITGRLQDLHSDQQFLHLEWPGQHGWCSQIVARGDAFHGPELQRLAHVGAPVSGNNAKRAVAYLEAFEATNRSRLPQAMASSRMGWCGEHGEHGFLVGRRLIRADAERDTSLAGGPTTWGDDFVHLDVSGGFDQVVEGYARAGSIDAWRDAIERVRPYPVAFLALYAGLVPPLLGILPNAPNFIVDWAFTSSTGKTTTLRIPGSIWGYPEDKSPHGVIQNWDFTTTSLERMLGFHNFLPLILDDTKRAKNPEWVIPQCLYMVAQGRGKGRGSIEGVRKTATWRTVVLSTGEVPVTSFSQDVGARARVLSITDEPFGGTSEETRQFVQQLTLDLLDNHGHAGPMVVQWLLQHRARWPRFRERYERLTAEWADQIGTNQFGGRAAPYLALLEVAAGIANAVLGIPVHEGALHAAFQAVQAGARDADRATAALKTAWAWHVAHGARFWRRWESQDTPHSGWAGAVIQRHRDTEPDAVAFMPAVLQQVLDQQGYDFEGVVREWAKRGWLRSNETNGRQCRASIGGKRVHTYAIDLRSVSATLGDEEASHAE